MKVLFIAAALLMRTSDPDRYHTAAGLALIYFTAAVGGFAAVRLNRRSAPLLCGLGEGLLLMTLLLAVGFFLALSLAYLNNQLANNFLEDKNGN